MDHRREFDIVIVGGGLSGSLAAWRMLQGAPGLRLALVEQDRTLGGNHTWSFFETDVAPALRAWLEPLITYTWRGYEVRFPALRRRLSTTYCSISSERLHAVITAALGERLMMGAAVERLGENEVTLTEGQTLSAPCIIDARGPRPSENLALAFQKFLGREVITRTPHGLERPIIMDATVPQTDGYRFVYTLPLAPDRLLIEDTYYSDDQVLSREALRARIDDYAASQEWRIDRVVREEDGVLPIVLAGNIDALLAESGGPPRIGLAAALFHPTTGYSLPDAARTADLLASRRPGTTAEARSLIAAHVAAAWRERSLFRLLNRMLFWAGKPQQRYRVLQRFYGFDERLIQRFYAAQPTFRDRARILVGRPPVPILSALTCVSEPRMPRMELPR